MLLQWTDNIHSFPCVSSHLAVDILVRGITGRLTKCGTLSPFRGGALSWLAAQLQLQSEMLIDYHIFVARLRAELGMDDHAKEYQATKAHRSRSRRNSTPFSWSLRHYLWVNTTQPRKPNLLKDSPYTCAKLSPLRGRKVDFTLEREVYLLITN
jgi:hypothetical protein